MYISSQTREADLDEFKELTSNRIDLHFKDVMPYNQEEADTRLILHGKLRHGHHSYYSLSLS